jgi:hypothetical protein
MTQPTRCSKHPKNRSLRAIRRHIRRQPARASSAAVVVIPLLLATAVAALRADWGATRQSNAPAVYVWYRGEPPGVPRQDDLAVIRAHGFGGVIWPDAHADAMSVVARMAGVVDLAVMTRGAPKPITAASATAPGVVVDVTVDAAGAGVAAALAWRAVAHGARQIAYDAREPSGSGVLDARSRPRSWVADAAGLSRQFTFNRRLFESLRAAPRVAFEGEKPIPLDVVLLDAGRSWLLVATNASRQEVKAIVRLPAGVPPALWLELIDGTNISMLSQRDGPRWTVTMPAGAARVYLVDKEMRDMTSGLQPEVELNLGLKPEVLARAIYFPPSSSYAFCSALLFSGPKSSTPFSVPVKARISSRDFPAFISRCT